MALWLNTGQIPNLPSFDQGRRNIRIKIKNKFWKAIILLVKLTILHTQEKQKSRLYLFSRKKQLNQSNSNTYAHINQVSQSQILTLHSTRQSRKNEEHGEGSAFKGSKLLYTSMLISAILWENFLNCAKVSNIINNSWKLAV